ncbi:MAG: VOC family protein [Dehalococcoidia bacterium]
MSQLNPYLHFRGEAREAMEFYKSVFGGELHLMSFKDAGMPIDASEENLVMHSELRAGNLVFMGSDTPSHMEANPGNSITMSLTGDEEAELRGYFEKLTAGGTIMQPLEAAPWGDTFGMLTDRFGIEWMVNISAGQQPS